MIDEPRRLGQDREASAAVQHGERPRERAERPADHRALDVVEQHTVVAWATKTLLAGQLLNLHGWRLGGDDVYRWFYTHQQPLPATQEQTDWISPDHDNLRGPAYYLVPPTTH